MAATPDSEPQALVPAWLLSCYFLIVVVGGVIANVLLVVTTDGGGAGDVGSQDGDDAGPRTTHGPGRGWWFLLSQLAAADALSLSLVSVGELWTVRETGGPWRLPAAACAPFMGLEALLDAAQTYLLVALTLHAWAAPTDPVPSLSVWRHVSRSAVVPSALVWMLASSVAVPRIFLAVAVRPRPAHPLCTLLPTSPSTGALEGPLDVVVMAAGPGPSGSWWPLGTLGVDGQGGGPLLSAVVLCALPTLVLLLAATAAAVRAAGRPSRNRASSALSSEEDVTCPPHKLERVRAAAGERLLQREWVRVSTCLSVSWLLMSLPRLASAAASGFVLPEAPPELSTGPFPGLGPWAFRAAPLGSRALDDASLLVASMLHFALTAARPVVAVLASPSLRRAALALAQHGDNAQDPPVSVVSPVDEDDERRGGAALFV
ncbi:hypothetical protein ONE63_010482 [Megalurothrips usitatus]|uniref:G-protein coupled receptors family 1 profile domain-containing protein n=1 Tax=Megalurothrips usitatus TaxID=439358 RepID=A0AAV7XD11_9NEOP|nr:hypothetical protein ONE63_010482 [Megalurothrips usitatus]